MKLPTIPDVSASNQEWGRFWRKMEQVFKRLKGEIAAVKTASGWHLEGGTDEEQRLLKLAMGHAATAHARFQQRPTVH